jgi:MFS transporter, MHS family, shikimate and dehydroshikimate transport protein
VTETARRPPAGAIRLVALASLIGTTIEWYDFWPQIGVPAGLLLSTAVFAQFARLPEAQFLAWGWRVPFLVSILLVAVGLVIRLRVLETPVFTRLKRERIESRRPALEVLSTHPREVLLAIGARLAENGAFYIYTVFVLVYGTQKVGIDREIVLNGILVAAACAIVAIPICGAISDRIGRRPVYLFGAAVTALWAYPLFRLLDTGSTPLVWLALVVALVFAHSPMYGPQAAFLAELFGTRVRYSGASLGSQLASVVAGGLSPFIATALLPYGRGALAAYVIAMALVTIASVFAASETRHRDIGIG